ncbi:MAG: hypothetical protein EA403_06330 [Spirochaetaceae bacterium]|nr:MAG: hypothetical protein EA403_06330 [Spirochaetaceae bacterium]
MERVINEGAARHAAPYGSERSRCARRRDLGRVRFRLIARVRSWMRSLRADRSGLVGAFSSRTGSDPSTGDETTIILGARRSRAVAGGRSITVRAGTVWITDRGRDVILNRGNAYCSNDSRALMVMLNPTRRPATVTIGLSGC